MSNAILHLSGLTPRPDTIEPTDGASPGDPAESAALGRNPFLVALGDRVRSLRARRGMTRKALALAADVTERHLANLECGVGNASILVLLQVADALQWQAERAHRGRYHGIARVVAYPRVAGSARRRYSAARTGSDR